jgi:hypothetical protein
MVCLITVGRTHVDEVSFQTPAEDHLRRRDGADGGRPARPEHGCSGKGPACQAGCSVSVSGVLHNIPGRPFPPELLLFACELCPGRVDVDVRAFFTSTGTIYGALLLWPFAGRWRVCIIGRVRGAMSDHADIAPNPAAALDGGCPVLLTFLAHFPAASEPQCWTE